MNDELMVNGWFMVLWLILMGEYGLPNGKLMVASQLIAQNQWFTNWHP